MSDFQSQDFEDMKESLDSALLSARWEMLRIFAKELMIILQKYDFTFDEFLDALSLYAEDFPEWAEAKEFIDRAISLLQHLRSDEALKRIKE